MASDTDTISIDADSGIVEPDLAPARRPLPSRLLTRGRGVLPWTALGAAAALTAVLAISVFTDGGAAVQDANRAALQHEMERYVASLESRAASVQPADQEAFRAALGQEMERYVASLESRAASIADG